MNANFTASVREGVHPLSVLFSDTTTGGTPVYRRWNYGDGSFEENTENPIHEYLVPGIYNVSLSVRDASGNEDTVIKAQHIIVNEGFVVPEQVIIQSQRKGLSPSWVNLDTYVTDDFSTGSIDEIWNSAFNSNYSVFDYNGTQSAGQDGSDTFQSLLPSGSEVSGNFDFEIGIITGSNYEYDAVSTENWAYVALLLEGDTAGSPSIEGGVYYPGSGTDLQIFWKVRQPLGGSNPFVEYGPVNVPASGWQNISILYTRDGSSLSFYYNVGSGWVQIGSSVTVLNTISVLDVLVSSREYSNRGYGFSYLNLEADRGLQNTSLLAKFWSFYIDSSLHLIFRYGDLLYKSQNPVAVNGSWMLLEFHAGVNQLYVGTGEQHRRAVSTQTIDSGITPSVEEDNLYVAYNSSMVIDDLRIWSYDKDLTEYYRSLKSRAYALDQQ